jgi:hypothetical protein
VAKFGVTQTVQAALKAGYDAEHVVGNLTSPGPYSLSEAGNHWVAITEFAVEPMQHRTGDTVPSKAPPSLAMSFIRGVGHPITTGQKTTNEVRP